MPVDRAVIKDIVDRLAKVKDSAARIVGGGTSNIDYWVDDVTNQLAREKEDEVEKLLVKIIYVLANAKDVLLKETKAVESCHNALEKVLADVKKAK